MEFQIAQDMESLMEIADCTAEDLARELGVSRVSVSNWLNNRTRGIG